MDTKSLSLALADDMFVQCQTLSPWTVNYVDLEESLAVGSIAQEVLAHGGVLYTVAGFDPSERDARVYARLADDWSVAGLSFLAPDHWPDLVAGAYLAGQASKVIVEALMAGSDDARQSLSLVHSEQVLHVTHWRRWISLLMKSAETVSEMSAAMNGALQKSGDLLPLGAAYDVLHSDWVSAISVDLAGWGIAAGQIADRTSRVPGGARIAGMVKDLRVARAGDGSSHYAVY